MKFGWKKTLIYSLIPVVALFALLEGAARIVEIWLPPWQTDFGWGFDKESRVFIPSDQDPGKLITNPSKEVSFQKQDFAFAKPPNGFRIFMLGGSSVNYLLWNLRGLAEGLTREFNDRYEFEALDAGGLAYGTHRLVPVLSEVFNYAPDMILFYEGHNEFEEVEQLELARLGTVPLQKVLYKSALCRFIRDRIAGIQVSRMQREKNKKILADPKADYMSFYRHTYTPEELVQRMDAYRNNLSLMAEMCRAKQIPLIIGTVPSNLFKPDFPDEAMKQQVKALYDQGEYAQGMALARDLLQKVPRHQSSDIENGIIRDVARQYGLPLADVEAAVDAAEPHQVPGETLFRDRCHLNDAGNDILIAKFKEQIVALLKSR